jgi:hypothetical protein
MPDQPLATPFAGVVLSQDKATNPADAATAIQLQGLCRHCGKPSHSTLQHIARKQLAGWLLGS